jgi:hypothetical protein
MKNLEAITKKDGSLTIKHKQAIQSIIQSRGRVYTCKWVRSGGRQSLTSIHGNVMDIVRAFGFKVESSNDAPRGGVEGNYVRFSGQAVKSLIKFIETK